jgi:hypothetical protein
MKQASISRGLLVRMRVVLVLLALPLSACTTIPAPEPVAPGMTTPVAEFSHVEFDRVLSQFVDERGRVDYAALARDTRALDAYYARLAAASPDSHPDLFPTEDARLAYWINAYNAAVIETVLYHYPIASVKDVRSGALFFLPELAGFFYLQRIELGGEKMNLYDLENGVIRKRFADPRVHFALNCASISCPRLPRHAFHASTLQSELEAETSKFIGESRNVDFATDENRVRLSSIFDWYASDFTDWMKQNHPDRPATLIGYVGLHLSPEQTDALDRCDKCEIEFVAYDWALNDQSVPASH